MEAATIFLIGIVSAFVGTTVGGGGLITVPALILLGLPPHVAVATTRIGALGLVLAGLYRFRRAGVVDWRIGLISALFAAVGALAGALFLLQMPAEVLEPAVGLLLLFVLPLIWVKPSLGVRQTPPGRARKRLGYLAYLPLGFWGGFFGAGYGILSNLTMLLLEGKTFLQAAATRKLPGTVVTLVALTVFTRAGVLAWKEGLFLLAGMALGSYAGASYGLRHGEHWVRRLFMIAVAASALALLWGAAN